MAFKNIVFDFGGVVLNWEPKALFREYYKSDEKIDAFMDEVGFYAMNDTTDEGRSFTEAVQEAAQQYPQHKDALLAYDRDWIKTITGQIPGTLAIMDALTKKGYNLYGITNFSEKFHKHKDEWTFPGYMKDIVVSADAKLIKPNPEIFKLAIKQFGINPQESVYIDDREDNVQSAEFLGFTGIVFFSSEQLQKDLDAIL